MSHSGNSQKCTFLNNISFYFYLSIAAETIIGSIPQNIAFSYSLLACSGVFWHPDDVTRTKGTLGTLQGLPPTHSCRTRHTLPRKVRAIPPAFWEQGDRRVCHFTLQARRVCGLCTALLGSRAPATPAVYADVRNYMMT